MESKFALVPIETLESIQTALSEIKQELTVYKKQNNKGFEDWISETEVMKLLGIKETKLYYLRKNGDLKATNTRPILYSAKSVSNYLERLTK